MRTLNYKVMGQRILRVGDHTGLVAGTKGYVLAKFEFDKDWEDCTKVASFYNNGEEYAVLLKSDECVIPHEALTSSSFKVSVEGRKSDYRILSIKIKETQRVRRDE